MCSNYHACCRNWNFADLLLTGYSVKYGYILKKDACALWVGKYGSCTDIYNK